MIKYEMIHRMVIALMDQNNQLGNLDANCQILRLIEDAIVDYCKSSK